MNGTLYAGVTADLINRVYEHKEGLVNGFTKNYKVKMLVFYESYQYVNDAIYREKCIKKWRREWKINLIQTQNPNWDDLYEQFI
ncbi:MAG: GIY-YIG nuclease family protein [Lentisphaerae bacterium]|nr:GIY-YIG nuclease family protein [Lentisphaerota bacterium]